MTTLRYAPLALRAASLSLLVTSSLALSIGACVGDDPTSATPAADATASDSAPTDAATTPSDATPPPTDAATADAADAATPCTGAEVRCGGVCVNTETSADHCGACGRSCGGGSCAASACSVATVRDSITGLNGFAVDDTSLYFTSGDKVASCPLGACTGVPKQLAAMVAYDALGVHVDSGFLYFESAPNQTTQRPAIFRCPVTGCPNPPVSIAADGLNGIVSFTTFQRSMYANLGGSCVNRVDCSSGVCSAGVRIVARPVGQFAVDAQRVYFNDTTGGGAGLASCPLVADCTRTTLTTTRVLGDIAVVGGLVYFVGPGITSGGEGVLACQTGVACPVPTVLTKTANPIPNLAADAKGIYWTEGDALRTCADVACVGGIRTLATGLANPGLLQLDAKFAYFRTTGATAGTSAIKRVAR
jgi:hypothetical protein